MTKSFPDLKKENIQIQEAQRVPNTVNPHRPTLRHKTKMAKVKDKEDFKGSTSKTMS